MPLSLYNLETEILEALRRINRTIELRSRALLLNYGLTAPQLTALQAIARLQPVTPARLSVEIHLGRPTVTGILNRLELRGLIERSRGGEDRRSVQVRLTEPGRRMLEGAPSVMRNEFHLRLGKLKEWERTQILASIQRLADMLDAGRLDDLDLDDDLAAASIGFEVSMAPAEVEVVEGSAGDAGVSVSAERLSEQSLRKVDNRPANGEH
jgi:DNA-binding MarR family transcriptional regulator